MGKKLRNLALLGGLGAAAYMMSRKKDDPKSESKEDTERDAREKFISRSSKTTESKEDRERDAREEAVSGAVKPRKAPVKKDDDKPAAVAKAPTREEGRTASGLPREARGVAGAADTGPETAEQNKARMEQLQKDQALKTVNPEMYLGPGRLLGGLNSIAKGLAARTAKKGSDTAKTSTSRDIVPAGPTPRFLGRGPREEVPPQLGNVVGAKKGGVVKSSASKRGDGIALRGKTRGRMV